MWSFFSELNAKQENNIDFVVDEFYIFSPTSRFLSANVMKLHLKWLELSYFLVSLNVFHHFIQCLFFS